MRARSLRWACDGGVRVLPLSAIPTDAVVLYDGPNPIDATDTIDPFTNWDEDDADQVYPWGESYAESVEDAFVVGDQNGWSHATCQGNGHAIAVLYYGEDGALREWDAPGLPLSGTVVASGEGWATIERDDRWYIGGMPEDPPTTQRAR